MTITNKISIIAILALLAVLAFTIRPFSTHGEAPTGQAAYLQVATTTTLTTTSGGNPTIFANVADGSCHARYITTTNAAIWITLADNSVAGDLSSTTLAVNNGLFQATGTTVLYDSGQAGCGRVNATSSVTTKIITSQL